MCCTNALDLFIFLKKRRLNLFSCKKYIFDSDIKNKKYELVLVIYTFDILISKLVP